MGADHTADKGGVQGVSTVLPKGGTVFDVFIQQMAAESGVAQQNRLVKVHAADILNLGDQQVVALFGATGFAQNLDFSFFYCDWIKNCAVIVKQIFDFI